MQCRIRRISRGALSSFCGSEEHAKLIERAKVLGKDVVKVAAGWILKTAGGSGISMALGLLALHDTAGTFSDKALQLRYLTSEALAYLSSSLDLAYILKNLPPQTRKDAEMMRFSWSTYIPLTCIYRCILYKSDRR